MSGLVLPFARSTQRQSDWSSQELAEFYRVESALVQAGLHVETERGMTDEGEPWFAFCRADDGEVIVHIARLGEQYVLAGPSYEGIARGHDIRSLVRDLVSRHPLVRVDGRQRSGSNVFLHPAALLVAVVATAFLKSGEAHAMGTDHLPAKGGLAALRSSWLLSTSSSATPAVAADSIGVDASHTAVVMSAVLVALNAPAIEQVTADHQPQQLSDGTQTASSDAPHIGLLDSLNAQPIHTSGLSSATNIALITPEGALFGATAPTAISASDNAAALSMVTLLSDLAKTPTAASVAAFDAHVQDLGGFSGATHAFEAAAIPAVIQSVDHTNIVLSVSTADSALPKVMAANLLTSDGIAAQFTHDQVSHVDKLPDVLTASLQNSAHTVIDLTQLPAIADLSFRNLASGSGSNSVADKSVDHSLNTTAATSDILSSANLHIDVTAAIRAFIADTPDYKVVTTSSDVVIYDAYNIARDTPSMHSVTWDFGDGSTLSLVGTAAALHDAAAHGILA
jgi:hypothetical protein